MVEDQGMMKESEFPNRTVEIRAVPAARRRAEREGIDLSLVEGSGPGGIILEKDIEHFRITQGAVEGTLVTEKIHASSLARKLAEKRGVPLETVEGTGTRGRIVMGDVIKATEKPVILIKEKGIFGQTIPMTQMRKVIAKRMAQSAFTAPHIYFFTDVEMDELIRFRERIVEDFEKEFKVRISINDFLIKAVGLTIRMFPMLNAMARGEEIYIMPDINVGLAVAIEEGLIVPAIPQTDQIGLGRIAQMRADLVDRARAGKLKLEEIERGTFTVTSLAQFDVVFFTAILNPPQSGILSIGKTFDRLTLKEEQVVVKKISRFGLSVDHRIVDGAVAAAFLQSLKRKLENPTYTFMHL
jgi:pyruvate dehydrogenase E2 component (dihydrolipoamide acetyltransferase)